MRYIYRFLGSFLFIFGILILKDEKIIGAAIGVSKDSGMFSLGIIWMLAGFLVILTGENLEIKVKGYWKKYPINRRSEFMDIYQGYLGRKQNNPQREFELLIIGKEIDDDNLNARSSYKEQFWEGHAAQGGRAIEVRTHIPIKGKNKGKLVHFGQPANSTYLWVVDEDGNFVVANRKNMHHKMSNMNKSRIDYRHRLHKLPHSTLARGKHVYGSGEVIIEGGLVKVITPASGHYVDLRDIDAFNEQCNEVFRYFMKECGWKEVKGGAEFKSS
jgi:hypothetical protein